MIDKQEYTIKTYSLTTELIKQINKTSKEQDRSASSLVRQILKKHFKEEKQIGKKD